MAITRSLANLLGEEQRHTLHLALRLAKNPRDIGLASSHLRSLAYDLGNVDKHVGGVLNPRMFDTLAVDEITGKPQGGLWTAKGDTWRNNPWAQGREKHVTHVIPKPNAEILDITSHRDLVDLYSMYPGRMPRDSPMPGAGSIDWVKASKDMDAVRFSGRDVLDRTADSRPYVWGIDVESTAWLRPGRYTLDAETPKLVQRINNLADQMTTSSARRAHMERASRPGYRDDPSRTDPFNFKRR